MGRAKAIRVAPVDGAAGRAFIRRHHYSGKTAKAQWLYLGVWDGAGELIGCMTVGRPIVIRNALTILRAPRWDSIAELGRLAMVDDTPRNVESRALSIMVRELRRRYPRVELLQTYADATQCGDGTIYRAAGFHLVGIRPNTNVYIGPHGERVMYVTRTKGKWALQARGHAGDRELLAAGYRKAPGFMLRYVRCLQPGVEQRLTVPILPYSAIAEAGAGMYRGQRRAAPGAGP